MKESTIHSDPLVSCLGRVQVSGTEYSLWVKTGNKTKIKKKDCVRSIWLETNKESEEVGGNCIIFPSNVPLTSETYWVGTEQSQASEWSRRSTSLMERHYTEKQVRYSLSTKRMVREDQEPEKRTGIRWWEVGERQRKSLQVDRRLGLGRKNGNDI